MNRALVLTGGGARGAYQAGVLKYIGENIPNAHFETLVGSSSGAINIAGVASHKGNLKNAGRHIAELWQTLRIKQVFRVDIFSLLSLGLRWIYDLVFGGVTGRPLAQSLVDTSPLRKLLGGLMRPDNIESAIESGELQSVAVTATEVYSGYAVTFVQSKRNRRWLRSRKRSEATKITVDHILASAAIPLLFPSVLVGDRRYVDGCIRSSQPLSPATRLGAERIFSIGVRKYQPSESGNNYQLEPAQKEEAPSPATLGALILNSLFSESLDSDVEHLERLNTMIPAHQEGSMGMRKIDVLTIRPSEDLGVIASKYHSRLPFLVRYLLRGLGSEQGESSDILSYLLFVPEYASALVDLGYKDAMAEDAKIRAFFSAE